MELRNQPGADTLHTMEEVQVKGRVVILHTELLHSTPILPLRVH
ncbi:hypothetical protein LINPERPRIM_LOCUS17286 [Linum perenne]